MSVDNELLKEAIETYGINVVNDVRLVMELTNDADGAYSTFEDMLMFDHMECIEMLYF